MPTEIVSPANHFAGSAASSILRRQQTAGLAVDVVRYVEAELADKLVNIIDPEIWATP
jgi:hypothetical protein